MVGVEPQGIPTVHAALAAGAPVTLDRIDSVAADSLGDQSFKGIKAPVEVFRVAAGV